ncbi:MAG: transposase [Polyangiaceae bacterium]|jgi:BMFP domain-containing protein YqiC
MHEARDRTVGSFNAFFDMLREKRPKAIVFVASDMWQAFRNVIQQALASVVDLVDERDEDTSYLT